MANANTGNDAETKPRCAMFSELESNYIIRSVHNYVRDNNYDLNEIVDGIREGNRMESRRLKFLWQQLAREMPTRSPKNIYQHAYRKLLKGIITPWTEEDKAQLVLLVSQKGKNWSAISKILNKLGDDCKRVYTRSRSRKRSGKFSYQEDLDLTQAIQQEMNLPVDLPLSDYPSKGIRWVNVAKRMGDERQNLDYLRRWATIMTKCSDAYKALMTEQQHVEGLNVSTEMMYADRIKLPCLTAEESLMRATLLLDYLSDPARGFSDESQVKFAEIDRTFSFPSGFASHKFIKLSRNCPRFSHFQEQIGWLRDKFGIIKCMTL